MKCSFIYVYLFFFSYRALGSMLIKHCFPVLFLSVRTGGWIIYSTHGNFNLLVIND